MKELGLLLKKIGFSKKLHRSNFIHLSASIGLFETFLLGENKDKKDQQGYEFWHT